jgi:hypothetical protein
MFDFKVTDFEFMRRRHVRTGEEHGQSQHDDAEDGS